MAADELASLDLVALVCSRVCHDLISPVSAIVNGLEVLEDEKDEAMRKNALELIRKSAAAASAKLQFCRLAFGAAGSAGAQIDLGDAEGVARGILQDDKASIEWKLPRVLLPKNRVKLLLNLVLVALSTIPRGGKVKVEPVGEGEAMGFRLSTEGTGAKIPAATPALLEGVPEGLDAHHIQPYYAGLLARSVGLKLTLTPGSDSVVINAA
jgi:histidine phosphotransferase ChpT